jgi:hypothetical protein
MHGDWAGWKLKLIVVTPLKYDTFTAERIELEPNGPSPTTPKNKLDWKNNTLSLMRDVVHETWWPILRATRKTKSMVSHRKLDRT